MKHGASDKLFLRDITTRCRQRLHLLRVYKALPIFHVRFVPLITLHELHDMVGLITHVVVLFRHLKQATGTILPRLYLLRNPKSLWLGPGPVCTASTTSAGTTVLVEGLPALPVLWRPACVYDNNQHGQIRDSA